MKREVIDLQAVKKRNMKRILQCIREQKMVSRAAISRMTSLTRATISSLTDELIKKGLVEEMGEGESNGGRRPILLRLKADGFWVIGIDLADEKVIRGYLCNLEASVLEKVECPYQNDFESILQTLSNVVALLQAKAQPQGKIVGVGIGVAALIDPSKNKVLFSANFDIGQDDLIGRLRERLGLPVNIENESNVGAWAEKEYGNGKGFDHILYVSKGKGIGAGIIIEGKVFDGGFFGAGEIGHIMVQPDGMKCSCGARGCLETLIGQSKILERVEKEKGQAQDINLVIEGYLNGDPQIKKVVDMEAAYLGKALAIAFNLLNVQKVILGGYVTGYGDAFLQQVDRTFREYVVGYYRERVSISFAKFGRDAVGIGGAALVLKKIWDMERI